MNEYIEQAEDFLRRHNIRFTTKFIDYDYHFADDKEPRDVFTVTFLKKNKRVSFRFGQSISNTDGWGSIPPTAYDVIASIQKYPVGTFENFCNDFGYDTDSISTLNIYKSVLKEWGKVSGFFTESELEEMQEIQ